MCVFVCTCASCMHMPHDMHVDSPVESVLYFHLYLGSGDQIWSPCLCVKQLYSLSHLPRPPDFFLASFLFISKRHVKKDAEVRNRKTLAASRPSLPFLLHWLLWPVQVFPCSTIFTASWTCSLERWYWDSSRKSGGLNAGGPIPSLNVSSTFLGPPPLS